MSKSQKTSSWITSGVLLAGVCLLFAGERILDGSDLSPTISGLGVVACLVAMVLRAAAFGRAQGSVRSAEGYLFVAYTGTVIGLAVYGLTTDAGLDALGLQDEARARAAGALTATWMAVLLVAGLAVLFLEQAYAHMPVAASVELRRLWIALQAGLTLSLSVVFLLAMNYVASERDVREDVSYFKTTEPSAGTLRMVEQLDTELQVVLFFQSGHDVLGRVQPYFERLAAASPKLTMEVVDLDLAPELARKHRVRGHGHALLLRGEGDEQRGKSIKIGSTLVAARANLRKLDGLFQQHFAHLVRPERKVHLTVGHGERNAKQAGGQPSDGTRTLDSILKRLNIETDDLGLADGLGSAVPDGSSAVLVMGPREPFMKEEAEALLGYVRKGGRVMLMLDPDVDVGLSPLLAGLAIELSPGTMLSKKHHMRRSHRPDDRALIYSNAYSSHPSVTTASRHSSEVATVFVRGTAMRRTDGGGQLDPRPKVVFPLRTANGFWRDLDGDFERGDNEAEQALNMMAAVAIKSDEDEGRLLVIGDGDFMTDKLAANTGNMLVFVDSLAWLIGNEELVAEVASEEDVKIEHSREEDKLWFYGSTFAVPVPILALGLWVARHRRRLAEAKS